MLQVYVKTRDLLERLRRDKDGMASFEYVIVAACIVAAASAVFGPAGSTTISTALSGGIGVVLAAFIAAV